MKRIAIIGAGPAGLMAAETLCGHGLAIDVYEAMPSPGRKFLLAGKGGLNLTHSEPEDRFATRYGERQGWVQPWLQRFGAQQLRAWAEGLGVETFVGTSGRVFPRSLKAAPLLRAWLHRLRESGVRLHMRHRWTGWDDEALRFSTPGGTVALQADACILALGGASWPQLGSDGRWVEVLRSRDVGVEPLEPANCGFDVPWSTHFRERFEGQPVKSVAARCASAGPRPTPGEFVITTTGVEGGLIYALSSPLRQSLLHEGSATLLLDLMPGRSQDDVARSLLQARGSRSLSEHLRRRLNLHGVKTGLLRECLPDIAQADEVTLAAAIKALPLRLHAARPIAEAISSAGGVRQPSLNEQLMLKAMPGVFCAGEMLDWEAPTGGYLLTACMASGMAAAYGCRAWLENRSR